MNGGPSNVVGPADAEPSGFADVPFEESVTQSGRGRGLVIVGVCVVVGAALGAALRDLTGSRDIMWLVQFAAFVLGVLLHSRRENRRARREARARAGSLAESGPMGYLGAVTAAVRGAGIAAAWEQALQILLSSGGAGTTIRVAPWADLAPVAPLALPFEPQPLNETLSTMMEGESGTGSPVESRQGNSLLRGLLRRNVTLSAGWAVVVCLCYLAAVALSDAVRQRRVTAYSVPIALGLFVVLLRPRGYSSADWFLVPGGLVLRRATWFQRRWRLHLFERRRSALLVARLQRKRWTMLVADLETEGRASVTQDEALFLLRAWLSPLPPPPLERLVDLR